MSFFFQQINSSNAQVLINLNLAKNMCANESKKIQFFLVKNHLTFILSFYYFKCGHLIGIDFYEAMSISLVPLQNVRVPKRNQRHMRLFPINQYFSNKWLKMCKKQQIHLTRGLKDCIKQIFKCSSHKRSEVSVSKITYFRNFRMKLVRH